MRIIECTTKITIGKKGEEGYERPRVRVRVRQYETVQEFIDYMSKSGQNALEWINTKRVADAKAAKRIDALAAENERLGLEPTVRRIEDTARFVNLEDENDSEVA